MPEESDCSEEDDISDNIPRPVIKDTSDDHAKDHYFDDRIRCKLWMTEIHRKLAIASELSKIQQKRRLRLFTDIEKKNAADVEYGYRMLDDIHGRVKRRNKKNRTSFIALFDIYCLIKKQDCCILLEPLVHIK